MTCSTSNTSVNSSVFSNISNDIEYTNCTDKLRSWAIKHKITRTALRELLIILNIHIPELNNCKDPR